MLSSVKQAIGKALVNSPHLQLRLKRLNEWAFWKKTLILRRGKFYNDHIEQFFTTFFQLDRSYYSGKRILDVGCGPVGTLEWADSALERVGVDPLADEYKKMNGGRQAMKYVSAPSENIPYRDNYFDVVTMFNALDHVEDVNGTVAELIRVLKPSGDLLLIVEINHPPSITEPHSLDESLAAKFVGCHIQTKRIFGIRDDHDVYRSLIEKIPYSDPTSEGIMCIHFRKTKLD